MPHISRQDCGITVFNFAALASALLRGISKNEPERYFQEGFYLTNITAIQLIFAGIVCLNTAQIQPKANKIRVFWFVAAICLIGLGIDDQFMIHEHIDNIINEWAESTYGFSGNSITKRLDDFIVLGYGGIALCFIRYFRNGLKKFLMLRRRFLLAIILFILMVIIDILSSRMDLARLILNEYYIPAFKSISLIVEETLKLVTAGVLLSMAVKARGVARGIEIRRESSK